MSKPPSTPLTNVLEAIGDGLEAADIDTRQVEVSLTLPEWQHLACSRVSAPSRTSTPASPDSFTVSDQKT
jgi:hypothetical protein